MQHSVGYDAKQFRKGILSKVGGIAADSVQRNEYVAPYPILMGIVEGDNVGEIIVAEKFAVYSQNLFVITKR